MRMIGWCEKCRKVKQVTVRRMGTSRVPMGICDACRDKQ